MARKLGVGVVLSLMGLMVLGLSAVGSTRFQAIAGDYQIDLTRLGMPLVIYLRIGADGTFMLSPNTRFDPSESRSTGVLAESRGVYMMIYKEHTPDNPKTATFVLDGPNLVFQSPLPYGRANIVNTAEDPDNPEIVYTLTADTLALSEYYGTYVGSHSTQAMGTTVDYLYTLQLKAGLRYVFSSEFTMGGTAYTYSETGSWSVSGDQLILNPADEPPVQGTITADGRITIGIRPSAMAAARTERVLRLATHAHVAGTYFSEKSTPMYTAKATMVLDMFGDYRYTVDVGQPQPYEESGSYDVADCTITFTPEGGTPYSATLENLVLTGSFRVSGAMPPTQMVMYGRAVQGNFAGSATHEGVEYKTLLTLNPNGTYKLLISDDAGQTVIDSTGTFQMQRAMTLNVVLERMDPAPICSVSESGLNFSIVLPGMTATTGMGGLGFSLKRQ
ncbi:MAG TPA: hypothetical protein ENN96_02650 [Candidatus Acetothermia bacterium]|nr:hypothetical protein [Candidatus Acetothermia bacterium]